MLISYPLFPSSSLDQINAISNSLSLKQIVTQPTHFSVFGSPSLIDLVFVPCTLDPAPCITLPLLSNSDRNCILCSIPLSSTTPTSPPVSLRRVWLYGAANFSLANKLLSSIPWSSILSSTDVNSAWLVFLTGYASYCSSKFVSSRLHPPWINRSFLSRIRYRNFLFKRAKLPNSPLDWSAFRFFRNKSLSYCRSLKIKFSNRLLSSPDSSHFWSTLKKFRKKNSSIPPLLSRSGCLVHSDLSKANLLNEFFSSCFNTSSPLNPSPNPLASPCPPDLCSTDNVLHLLHLPSDTATGPDGLSSRMLKATAHSIAPALTSIFNLSIQSSTFPSDWKCSYIIVLIPKTNCPSSTSDFRPLSLLCIVSKLLERHIHNYLFVITIILFLIVNLVFALVFLLNLLFFLLLTPGFLFLTLINLSVLSLIYVKLLILFPTVLSSTPLLLLTSLRCFFIGFMIIYAIVLKIDSNCHC